MSEEINPEELMRKMDALIAEIEKQKALDGEDSRVLVGLKRTIDEARTDVAEDIKVVRQRVDEVSNYVAKKFGEANTQADAIKSGLQGAFKGFKDNYRKAQAPKKAAPAPAPEAKPAAEPDAPTGK